MTSTHSERNKHANFPMDSEKSFEYRKAIGGNMVASNASTVITLVAEPWERHEQLPCLAGSASFSVEDFRTRKQNRLYG